MNENEIVLNSKERSEAIAEFTLSRIAVRPYNDQFLRAIAETMKTFPGMDELKAIDLLVDTSQVDLNEIGGEVENYEQLKASIMEEFGCTKKTAIAHINRAKMRKHFPNVEFPQWGGIREGAGRPSKDEDADLDDIAAEAAELVAHHIEGEEENIGTAAGHGYGY